MVAVDPSTRFQNALSVRGKTGGGESGVTEGAVGGSLGWLGGVFGGLNDGVSDRLGDGESGDVGFIDEVAVTNVDDFVASLSGVFSDDVLLCWQAVSNKKQIKTIMAILLTIVFLL